ncbi:MAG: helix-turn-helix domain-containing protein [Rikenellaceae bacterium]
MTKILELLQTSGANLKLEVTGADLLDFSNDLINRAKSELSAQVAAANQEKYLTKEEVMKLCDVCDTTLWHWNKRGYLKCIKVGNKVRYRKSDLMKILGEEKSATFKLQR